MTGSNPQVSRQWHRADAVVAAYAGSSRGRAAFDQAIAAMKQALPGARVWTLCPAEALIERDDVDFTIEYPSPRMNADEDAAARDAALRAVGALEACRARAALVFAERGSAPYVPAYLCYLAGITYRAGAEAEFGGAVLSPALRLGDESDDADRHFALLAAVGLARREGTRVTPISPAFPSANRSIEWDR